MPPPTGGVAGAPLAGVDLRRAARASAGRVLWWTGALLLPLTVGAGAGYWVADRGARWLPTTLGALVLLGLIGVVCMAAGLYLLGPAVGRPRGRRRIVALGVLAVLGAGARVGLELMGGPSPLTSLDPKAHELAVRLDARQVTELDRALGGLVDLLAARGDLFAAGGPPRVLTADEEALVLEAWEVYLGAATALDALRRFHEDYFRFDLSRLERRQHLGSYLVTFLAELTLYERTAALVDLLGRNANVVTFLDLARPERGIPAGSLSLVRREGAGAADLARVLAGKRWLQYLALVHDARFEAAAAGLDLLWAGVEAQLAALERRGLGDLATLTLGSDAAPLRSRLGAAYLPVQARVAEWIGDTRVGRPVGRYLIGPELGAEVAPRLRPGDVLLARKNWYLSNVALPGFWPHGMLWVGTPADLAAAFDADPEVTAWVEATSGRREPFTAFMARSHPRAWAAALAAEGGHEPLVIVEAISEGVVQSPLAHAAGDYFVGLRPRLPAWVRAQAIWRAHGYLGRPYDFDFDFASDTALVCTEVVWRSYRPLGDAPGLRLEPIQVAGRRALPAHEIARTWARERGRPDAQLELVVFVDALERERRAFVSDEAGFLSTVTRPQWDVVQR